MSPAMAKKSGDARWIWCTTRRSGSVSAPVSPVTTTRNGWFAAARAFPVAVKTTVPSRDTRYSNGAPGVSRVSATLKRR